MKKSIFILLMCFFCITHTSELVYAFSLQTVDQEYTTILCNKVNGVSYERVGHAMINNKTGKIKCVHFTRKFKSDADAKNALRYMILKLTSKINLYN